MYYDNSMEKTKSSKKPVKKTVKKKKTGSDILINILLVVFAGVFIFSAYQLGSTLYESYLAKKTYQDLNNLVEPTQEDPPVNTDTNEVISTDGYFLVESKYNSEIGRAHV